MAQVTQIVKQYSNKGVATMQANRLAKASGLQHLVAEHEGSWAVLQLTEVADEPADLTNDAEQAHYLAEEAAGIEEYVAAHKANSIPDMSGARVHKYELPFVHSTNGGAVARGLRGERLFFGHNVIDDMSNDVVTVVLTKKQAQRRGLWIA